MLHHQTFTSSCFCSSDEILWLVVNVPSQVFPSSASLKPSLQPHWAFPPTTRHWCMQPPFRSAHKFCTVTQKGWHTHPHHCTLYSGIAPGEAEICKTAFYILMYIMWRALNPPQPHLYHSLSLSLCVHSLLHVLHVQACLASAMRTFSSAKIRGSCFWANNYKVKAFERQSFKRRTKCIISPIFVEPYLDAQLQRLERLKRCKDMGTRI